MVYDARHDKPLTDFDRMIVGKAVRITLPLSSRLLLGDAADILRGLANQLDHLSRRHDISERTALTSAKGEAQLAQQKIRSAAFDRGIIVREGRPTNAEMLERKGITDGTVSPLEIKRHRLQCERKIG